MRHEIIENLFSSPATSFVDHLDDEDNHRIFFSGKYGTGKTTFLNYFFDRHEYGQNFNVFHISPVNYSVLKNEDIFRYIKYDILYSLITKYEGSFAEASFDKYDALQYFAVDHFVRILATASLLIPSYGKQLSKFLENSAQIRSRYESYRADGNTSKIERLQDFVGSIHESEGAPYERNQLTEIITANLEQLSSESERQNVLVIDDIDRIDPAHIFRILNVFQSHVDERDSVLLNKYGFHKIVIVGDIQNIRSIFQATYGGKTDFNGYIDKFYSRTVFKFDNRQSVISILSRIIESFTLIYNGERIKDNGHFAIIHLQFILSCLLSDNLINLRSLFSCYGQRIKVGSLSFKINGHSVPDHPTLCILEILTNIFGDYNYTIDRLQNLSSHNALDGGERRYEIFIGSLVTVCDFEPTKFRATKEGQPIHNYSTDTKNMQIPVQYDVIRERISRFYYGEVRTYQYSQNEEYITIDQLHRIDFVPILKKALKNIVCINHN